MSAARLIKVASSIKGLQGMWDQMILIKLFKSINIYVIYVSFSFQGTLIQHLKEHILHGNMTSSDVIIYYTTVGAETDTLLLLGWGAASCSSDSLFFLCIWNTKHIQTCSLTFPRCIEKRLP